MRRIGRWMLNGLTCLSVVLFALSAIAIVLAHRRCCYNLTNRRWDELRRIDAYTTSIRQGRLSFGRARQTFNSSDFYQRVASSIDSDDPSLGSFGRWEWETFYPNDSSMEPPAGPDLLTVGGARYGHSPAAPFWGDMRAFGAEEEWWLVIPVWWVALLSALMPFSRVALAVRVARRRRRDVVGRRCVICHYDLTANVSGVCPECGTKIAEAR